MADDHRWCTADPFHERRGRPASRNAWLVPCFLLVDYTLLAGIGVLWFLLEFTDYMPAPIPRGFWCDERQYMKPYLADKLVPERGLYVICFTVPVISILFGESLLALCKHDSRRESFKLVRSCSIKLYTPLRRAIRFIGVFAVGGFGTWVVTNFIQILTGQMTPYFFAACQPDACSPLFGPAGRGFVTDYMCLTGDKALVDQARRSLPSVHASLGAYSSIFLTLYLSSQVRLRGVRLPVPLFCLIYTSCAVVWGLTRAASYRHHWSDVLAGFALGATFALYLSLIVLRCFREVWAPPPHRLTTVPSQASMFISDEGHFACTAPSSFVLPRVQQSKTGSPANASRSNHASNGYAGNGTTISNPSYLEDMLIVHHSAHPGSI